MGKDRLTEKYKKATSFEAVLNSLNSQLSLSQKELFKKNNKDQTSIHVIGSPRSGTTLLMQLLISNFDLGYVNNFIATFWNAPLYGIHLSKKLLGDHYKSNLKSDFGRTNNIQEPHEFGYFWKHHLQYKDHLQQTYNPKHTIDWDQLRQILYQMGLAYNKPIIYKSFLYGFHIEEAVKMMPKTLFIHIKRDLYQNAFSILKLRKKMFGDETVWASMKPHQYSFLKNENIYRQIIGQILFLNYEYEKQLKNIPSKNKLVIEYSNLCNNTGVVLENAYNKITGLELIKKLDHDKRLDIIENKSTIFGQHYEGFKEAELWLKSNFKELTC